MIPKGFGDHIENERNKSMPTVFMAKDVGIWLLSDRWEFVREGKHTT